MLSGVIPRGDTIYVQHDLNGFDEHTQVAMARDGRFVVVFDSDDENVVDEPRDVYARIFDADGSPLNGELRVNTAIAGSQSRPAVAINADGSFIVVWESETPGVDFGDIMAQRFSATGTRIGDSVRVNTKTSNVQRSPDIVMSQSGEFVVSWLDSENGVTFQRFLADASIFGDEIVVSQAQSFDAAMGAQDDLVITYARNGDIFARRFRSDGEPRGAEVPVAVSQNPEQLPTISSDANGNFAVAWADRQTSVRARLFDKQGVAEGGELLVAEFPESNVNPSVSMDPDGDFVVTWEQPDSGSNDRRIYGRYFENGGEPIAPAAQLTSHDGSRAHVAMDGNGDFLIAYDNFGDDGNGYGSYARRYLRGETLPEPTAVGPEVRVDHEVDGRQSNARVATADDGSSLIVWENADQDGDGQGIFAQAYEATGRERGRQFRINTTTVGHQYAPDVTADAAGNFIVVWQGIGSSGVHGIQSQRLSPYGVPLGAETRVSLFGGNDDSSAQVASIPGGGYYVAWTGVDASDSGIFARRFDADGIPQTGVFPVNQRTEGRQREPAIVADASGNLVATWMSLFQSEGRVYDIFVRRLAPDGIPLGDEVLVNGSNTWGWDGYPDIAADNTGRFSVIWDGPGASETSDNGIWMRHFDATGSPAGQEFLVNQTRDGWQGNAAIAADHHGRIAAVWTGHEQDVDGAGIFARHFGLDERTAASQEFQVHFAMSGDQFLPDVAATPTGNFRVTWETNSVVAPGIRSQRFAVRDAPFPEMEQLIGEASRDVVIAANRSGRNVAVVSRVNASTGDATLIAQRFDDDGFAVGNGVAVTEMAATQAAVAMADDGGFVVTWQGRDADSFGIFAHSFSADGTPIGEEFRVNSNQAGSQRSPEISMNDAGEYVITWTTTQLPGGGGALPSDVAARKFRHDGSHVGTEILIGSNEDSDLTRSDVAIAPEGEFILTWMSDRGDGSFGAIYAQRFTAAAAAAGAQFRVNTTAEGTQEHPRIAMNGEGSFSIAWLSRPPGSFEPDLMSQSYSPEGRPDGGEQTLFSWRTEVSAQTAALPKLQGFSIDVSEDGRLAVALRSVDESNQSGIVQILVIEADGTRLTPLTRVSSRRQQSGYSQEFSPALAHTGVDSVIVGWHQTSAANDTPHTYLRRLGPELTSSRQSATDPQRSKAAAAIAFQLDQQEGFYGTGDYSENWGGSGEKWFRSQSLGWFFIAPDGIVYRWKGATPGTSLAEQSEIYFALPTEFHEDPSLLHDASPTSANLPELAVELDLDLGLYSADSDYENWAKAGEKWLLAQHGEWFFISPTGGLYRWLRSATGADLYSQNPLVASLSSAFHQDPSLLHNAATDTRTIAEKAFQLNRGLGLQRSSDAIAGDNWAGLNERWFRDSGRKWYFLLPNGDFYRWTGAAPGDGFLATNHFVASLSATFHASPELLLEAPAPDSLMTSGLAVDSLAYFVDQRLQLAEVDPDRRNFGGVNEKWMLSFSGVRYFITPNGVLYQYTGATPGNDFIENSKRVAELDERYYTSPESVVDADADTIDLTLLAFALDRELRLEHTGLVDWGGANEKWLWGRSGDWYFVTPDGCLYQWTGASSGSDFVSGSRRLVDLGASFYRQTSRLTDNAGVGAAVGLLSIDAVFEGIDSILLN